VLFVRIVCIGKLCYNIVKLLFYAVEDMDMNEFYTPKEISSILKISVQSVRNLIREGKIPAIKVGKQWRVRKVDLERYTKGESE
jgi:excisionase family DNA binding protein